jgi:hypothetical protein
MPKLFFTAVKTLYINTKGVALLRLSLPLFELATTVLNSNGTLAYKSTRAKRSSVSCVLYDTKANTLLKTTYYFGPRKKPIISRVNDVEDGTQIISGLSKWTSRSQTFLFSHGREFAWKYERGMEYGTNGAKGTALVLKHGEKQLAALIRNEGTRASGSKSCSAGSGGKLLLGEGLDGIDGLSEDLVVATCLLMLKKEVDRRRAVQFMVIAGA